MILFRIVIASVIALGPAIAAAQQSDWRKYVVAETGANVDVPTAIFSSEAGKPEKSVRNDVNNTPSAFLAKKRPPRNIVYRRVTPNFFVVSSFRNGLIWYDRCNFSGRVITCVLINYPASEKKQWDSVVTRISNSLAHG